MLHMSIRGVLVGVMKVYEVHLYYTWRSQSSLNLIKVHLVGGANQHSFGLVIDLLRCILILTH